jgi:hypothetical protein
VNIALEITNNSRFYAIPLVVGRRIAQIVFFRTGEILDKSYAETGKYQQNNKVIPNKHTWSPSEMTSKMHLDREVQVYKQIEIE